MADPPALAVAGGRAGSSRPSGPPPHEPTDGPSAHPPRRTGPAPRPDPPHRSAAGRRSGPATGLEGPAASPPGTPVVAAPTRSDRRGGGATPRHGDSTGRSAHPS